MDTKAYFDRCFVLTLKRTPQRLESFQQRIAACNWPFREVEVVYGIDGRLCPPAPWFTCGAAAWGCFRAHHNCLETALNDGAKRILVLEDDAEFCEGFAEKAIAFLAALPQNAELIYMGGQLNHRRQDIRRVNELIIQPESANRLHAYALSRTGMEKVYRHWNRWNWYRGEWEEGKDGKPGQWKGGHHCDHRIETLSRAKDIVTYAPASAIADPPSWLIDQAASYSEILGRHLPPRSFTRDKADPPKVIAVLGPYCGGTSAVAGALHHLGIIMGHKFFGGNQQHTPNGCYEAQRLFEICNQCYPEPAFAGGCQYTKRVELLQGWAAGRCKDGAIIGAKHPKLCLMVPEMVEAWPECKFIVVHRDVEKSIDSITKLGWFAAAIEPDVLIRRMVDERNNALASVPGERVLDVVYDDLLADPRTILEQAAEFACIEPKPEQYSRAIAHLDAGLNHHHE
jgi:hypothetical protein